MVLSLEDRVDVTPMEDFYKWVALCKVALNPLMCDGSDYFEVGSSAAPLTDTSPRLYVVEARSRIGEYSLEFVVVYSF